LFAVSLLTFVMMHSIPGGPFDTWGGQYAPIIPRELVIELEHRYGLDQPVMVQYWKYLQSLFRFDFGYSFISSGRSINDLLAEHWPFTLQLGLLTFVFAFPVGLGLGIISAMKEGSWIDRWITGSMLVIQATPSFVVSVLLVYLVSVKLNLLPTQGWDGPIYWVMPVFVNSLGAILVLQRYTRNSMLDAIGSDYVRTARAKGLTERRVTLVHVFKNALTPIVTVAGPIVAGLVTGSFFVEGIFRIPGLGWYLGQGVGKRDYPMIMVSTLLFTAVVTLTYLFTDMAYALVDPRVTYSGRR
jgi:ABC-type dipeptide/oligopeptide/nickel transport system permease component